MKRSFFFLLLLLLSSAAVFPQSTTPSGRIKIAVLSPDLPAEESRALNTFLQEQKDFKTVKLNYGQLSKESFKRLGLTHIWIHKLSPAGNSKQEIAAGNSLKEFVKNGGNLIVSMDAVLLLNHWGIEKNPFEVKTDSVKDEGFGRPLGFHAFKSHPVFEGLNGGVYSWKGKKDHVIRKIGFFNHNLPDTAIAEVIGIEWTYITFHEQNKLVLEYRLGKGKIIAVGAYSYFADENFNTLQLHRFYRNLFEYTAGGIRDIKPYYWNYASREVIPMETIFSETNISPAKRWNLPELNLEIKKQEGNSDFVSLAGRRMLVMGKQKGGIDEIWTHPFMSFRDVEAAVIFKGADSTVWLNKLVPSVTISPELIIREYRVNGTSIKEITTVSMDKPVAVVHYEWDGPGIEKILLKYTSNFRYMWPYSDKASAAISYRWSPGMNAAVSSAQGGDLASIMGFSAKPDDYLLGQYKDFKIEKGKLSGGPTDLIQVSGVFSFNAADAKGNLSAYLVAGNEGLQHTLNIYQEESQGFEQLFDKSSRYFSKLLNTSMIVTTPDEAFNTGYKWALARTDQFFQETPGLGTSLMAGFGTTARGWGGGQKISGRPGYAWYFGRDAQWSGMAINAYGGHEMVQKTLDVFVKFQDLNGKIYHELTSSGAVHYDASDATPLYVVLAANYLRHSGNLAYIRKIWPSIKKAMDFCYSTDTDKDGLIEITNVGHGWIEGGPLFGAHTEVYLAGTWVAALDAASYMSSVLKQESLSKRYSTDAAKVRNIIDEEFWNKEARYFSNGKMIDGSFMKEETILSAVPVYFNAVSDPVKAQKTTASFSGNGYSTDWGLRILPESSKLFNPGAYHAGMVWPLFSGFASLAEYKTGAYVSGFTHIMDNLLLYRNYGLGSAEETLNGLVYKPAGVCYQQGWSETMILQPISEGMLGMQPDALANQISLSPRFPWHWKEVKVENIRFGNHYLNFSMNSSQESTVYHFKKLSGNELSLFLRPSLPAGTSIQKVLINSQDHPFSTTANAESISLELGELKLNETTTIEIVHLGGIGALALINEPQPGDTNKGAKIIRQELSGKRFNVTLEGLSGSAYQFEVLSNFPVKSVKNGQIINQKGNIYTISLRIDQSAKKYFEQKVTLEW
jgi:glycogen debranching enzyme